MRRLQGTSFQSARLGPLVPLHARVPLQLQAQMQHFQNKSVKLNPSRFLSFSRNLRHSHNHGGPNFLVEGGGFKNPGVRITWIGLLVNLGMAAGKGVGGIVFHSQSLLADAVHAVSDMISDVLTLCTVSVAKKPTNSSFPNGYGRIETMGTLGVSALLLMASISMGYSSVITILETFYGDSHTLHVIERVLNAIFHSHAHTASPGGEVASWDAAWVGLGSIFVKEALFQTTHKIGVRENSPVLIANAWHHRVDCLASAVSVASIAGGQLLGLSWLDPLGGLIISIMIWRAGWAPAKNAAKELAGSLAVDNPAASDISASTSALATLAPSWEFKSVSIVPYGSTNVVCVYVKPRTELVSEQPVFQELETLKQEIQKIQHVKTVYIVLGDGPNL